jgi:pilus assembly protein FimV
MVLDLPSAEQVYEVTRSSAVNEVGRQNEDLSYSAPIDASPEAEVVEVPSVSQEQGHLSLAASGDSEGNGDGEKSTFGNGDNAVLSSENVSLNKQVDSLSTQVEQLERLLEIKEQQLAQFQNQLANADSDVSELQAAQPQLGSEANVVEASDTVEVTALGDEPVLEVAEVETDIELEPELEEPSVVDESVGLAADPAVADEVEATEPADAETIKNTQVTESSSSSMSLLDTLLATPMYLGGIALLIMGLVAGLFIRKRNQAEQAAIDTLESFEFEQADDEAEDIVAEPATEDQEAEVDETEIEQVAADVVTEPAEEVKVETGDAIGEAEIYIAYGRFDQAAELLKGALDQSPDDVALRSKLLEVYAQAGEQQAFLSEFSLLEQQGETDAVNSAKELLSSVDGGSSWLNDHQQQAEPLDDLDDLDLSLDLDNPDSEADSVLSDVSSLTDGDDQLSAEQELELDLDLDLNLDAGPDTEQNLDLDLDLDLDSAADSSADSVNALEGFDLDLDTDIASDSEVSSDELVSLDLDLAVDSELDLDDDFGASASETAVVEEVLDTLDDAVDDLSLDLDALEDASAESLDLELGSEIAGVTEDLNPSSSLNPDDNSLDVELSQADDEVLDLGDLDLDLSSSDEPEIELDLDDSLALGEELDLSAGSEPDLDLEAGSDLDVQIEIETESAEDATSAELNSAEDGLDDDLSFITDEDEISTKLDLARAYVEMGDADGAKDILTEVVEEGSDAQVAEAKSMLGELV